MEIIETDLTFRDLTNRESTRRIILHHSACENCTPEDIHRWHINNGWAGAGYHFLVRKDGKIYRLRPEDKVGAHAYGNNYNSIGICAEGNFETEEMSEVQKNAIKELVSYLKNKYGIDKVQKHKDVNATDCPGFNYPFDEIVNGANEVIEESKHEDNERVKAVKELQEELNKQFNAGLKVDGIFGSKTKEACVNVRKGARGNLTYIIQKELHRRGYNTNGVDGIFGPATEKAVKQFQRDQQIAVDGIVGKNTFEKMFKE